jgi:hypothetical protein
MVMLNLSHEGWQQRVQSADQAAKLTSQLTGNLPDKA